MLVFYHLFLRFFVFGRLFAHLYETKNRGFVRYLFCYKSLFVGLHKFLRTVSGTLPFFLLHSDKFSLPKGGGGFLFPCKMCYNTPQKGRPLPAGHCPPQVGRPAGRPPLQDELGWSRRKSTVVMGVIFVDIKGFPSGKYHATGTNPGNVRFVHGGVARNVAEDMARIGIPVTFVTQGDTTPMSREAMERLEAQKVNLTYSIHVPQNGVGLWLAVMDEKGDLAGSTSQMPDTEPLNRYLRKRERRSLQVQTVYVWKWIWARR